MKDDGLSFEGIRLITIILGFVGAALGISYTRQMSKRDQWAALLSGVAMCMLIPQASSDWWHSHYNEEMSPAINNIVAFLSGLFGMFIVPGLLVIGEKFKTNPWWVIDWVRGFRKNDDQSGGGQ